MSNLVFSSAKRFIIFPCTCLPARCLSFCLSARLLRKLRTNFHIFPLKWLDPDTGNNRWHFRHDPPPDLRFFVLCWTLQKTPQPVIAIACSILTCNHEMATVICTKVPYVVHWNWRDVGYSSVVRRTWFALICTLWVLCRFHCIE